MNAVRWSAAVICLIAGLAAGTARAADAPGVALECQQETVYLWSVAPDRSSGAQGCRSLNYSHFARVLFDSKLPEQGLFNVNGKPVTPSLILAGPAEKPHRQPQPLTKMRTAKGGKTKLISSSPVQVARPLEVEFNGKDFDVLFRRPGTYTLKAVVGTVSDTAEIEVKQLPFWRDMPAATLIKANGFPDKKTPCRRWLAAQGRRGDEVWEYAKYPGVGIIVEGDPGRVVDYVPLKREANPGGPELRVKDQPHGAGNDGIIGLAPDGPAESVMGKRGKGKPSAKKPAPAGASNSDGSVAPRKVEPPPKYRKKSSIPVVKPEPGAF